MNSPLIVELDFGMGNIRSLQKAFEHLGQQIKVSQDFRDIAKADAIVLPGDGHFGKAVSELKEREMIEPLIDFYNSGRPILGVCIGFQLLFESSEEADEVGFGFFDGQIKRFTGSHENVPHMGWTLTKLNNARLTRSMPDETYFYYVHSYRLPDEQAETIGFCEYEGLFTSIVENKNLFGTQFHPEKSQKWGLKLLDNFISIVKEN